MNMHLLRKNLQVADRTKLHCKNNVETYVTYNMGLRYFCTVCCSGSEFIKTHHTPDKKKFQQCFIITYTFPNEGWYSFQYLTNRAQLGSTYSLSDLNFFAKTNNCTG